MVLMPRLLIEVATREGEALKDVEEAANEMISLDHDRHPRYHGQGRIPAEASIVHESSRPILPLAAQDQGLAAQGGELISRRNQCAEPPGLRHQGSLCATSS